MPWMLRTKDSCFISKVKEGFDEQKFIKTTLLLHPAGAGFAMTAKQSLLNKYILFYTPHEEAVKRYPFTFDDGMMSVQQLDFSCFSWQNAVCSDISEIDMALKFLQSNTHPHGNGYFFYRWALMLESFDGFISQRRMKYVLQKQSQLSFHNFSEV